jgi:hypothetical protein
MLTVTTALHQLHDDKASGIGTIFLIFCFYLFYDIAYTPLLVSYAVEILPFNIRAKGFALMVSCTLSREKMFTNTDTVEHCRLSFSRLEPVHNAGII